MKSNIDLTENRDFDPKRFKKIKVSLLYYSNDGTNKAFKTPWDRSGKILSDHKLDISFIDEYGDILSIYNFDYGLSFNGWNSIDLSNRVYSLIRSSRTTSQSDYTVSWIDSLSRDIRSFYSYNMTTSSSTTFDEDGNKWTLSMNNVLKPAPSNGFRLGRVSEMKKTLKYAKDIRPKYHGCHAYELEYKYSDIIRYMSQRNDPKYLYSKISKFKKYSGYEPDIELENVGDFKHNREDSYYWDTGSPLYDILYDMLDKRTDLNELEGATFGAKQRWINHRIKGHHIPSIIKKSIIMRDSNSRRIKWPDYHDDYLREISGLRPRNDWRHGINTSNTFYDNDTIIA